MSVVTARSLEETFQQIQQDPAHPAEAIVDALRVEVRVKAPRSAADLFREVGP